MINASPNRLEDSCGSNPEGSPTQAESSAEVSAELSLRTKETIS
jgi:hypothetical protein